MRLLKIRDKLGRFIKGTPSNKRKDLTGKTFGMLTVLEMIWGYKLPSGKSVTKCKCVCDCGNVVIKSTEYLKTQNPSCGCLAKINRVEKNRINLVGKKYGRLTVLEMLYLENVTKCLCECTCGNKIIVRNTGLTSGKTTSCGCYQRQVVSKSNTKDFSNQVAKSGVKLLNQYKKNKHGTWMWKCLCPCGNIFYEIPAKILNLHTTSCGCKIKSAYERYIEMLLEKYNISYKPQYSFDDCVYKHKLKFDFAVFKENKIFCLIEYDGRQHFYPIDFFGGQEGFEDSKIRDKIKDKYCLDNNINLIRIPYNYTDKLIEETILNIKNA